MHVHVNTGLAKRPSFLKRLFRELAYCPHDHLMVLTYSRSLMCVDCGAVAQRDENGVTSGKFQYGEGSLRRIAHICAVWFACLAASLMFWYFGLAILIRAIQGVR